MAKKKSKGKRKDLLKTDPQQKENLTYEKKLKADSTITGKTVEPPTEFVEQLKKTIQVLTEEKKDKQVVSYTSSRPKTEFNMRKRTDQTN